MNKDYDLSFAVIIGIHKLEDGSILLQNIPNAVNDAKAIGDVLISHCGFSRGNIYSILKEDATKSKILETIEMVLQKTKKNDRLLIFFAGHGDSMVIKKTEEGYIVPYDAVGKKGKPEWDSVIPFCDLIKLISEKSNANQNLFLIDCCFSGIACKRIDIDSSERHEQEKSVNAATERKSIEIFTASSKNEKIMDGGDNYDNSVFTKNIVDFISNAKPEEYADTGYVSARRMSDIVKTKVAADSWRLGTRQEPQFVRANDDEIGNFVVRKFSNDEIFNAQDKPEIEFSEIDELIAKADLYEIVQNKQKMLDIIKKSTVGYENRSLSTSKIYGLIFEYLRKDPYVSEQLKTLTTELQLTELKVVEIMNSLCINIIASGVQDKIILTTIPTTIPKANKIKETLL